MIIARFCAEFSEKIDRGIIPNIYYLSKYQAENNEVHVFALGDKTKDKKVENFYVHWVKRPRLQRVFGGYFLFKRMQELGIKPDVVHGLNPISFGWLFKFYKNKIKTKWVISLHCSITPLKNPKILGLGNKIKNYEFEKLAKFVAKHSDKIIAVAEVIKKELLSIGVSRKKIFHIPSGIELSNFYPAKKKKITNEKRFLFVGRFVPVKNIPEILEYVNKYKGPYSLTLVGGKKTDESYNEVTEKIKSLKMQKKVRIVPPVSQKELLKYYQNADVFLNGDNAGNFYPKTILEARACGLDIVVLKKFKDDDVLKKHLEEFDWKIISNKMERVFR